VSLKGKIFSLKEYHMKQLLKKSVEAGMSYTEYNLLFKQLVAEGRTTGESSEEKINFTKLNWSRSKRLDKTGVIPEALAAKFQIDCPRQTWLVISEPWCGDAAQTLPFLNKMAALSPNLQLTIVLRDEHPELMDAFLTNGSRGIPKLIMLNDAFEVLGTWGPRSAAATALVTDYKNAHGALDAQFKEQLQIWYNQDRGVSIITDVVEQFQSICRETLSV
jgi:hypothetical protein